MTPNYSKQWEFLKNNFEGENLAHAFLFSGQDIASIESFAKEFIKFVNCLSSQVLPPQETSKGSEKLEKQNLGGQEKPLGRSPTGEPCLECQNCKIIEHSSFPDLLVVRSSDSESSLNNEKDMMEITIKQIRAAQSFLDYKSYYGRVKSIIVENAERMNLEAQSCFLKTLEEPKGQTLILLLSPKPDVLLSTILSRCQQLKFFQKNLGVLSKDEEMMLQDVKKILGANLAEKFNYVKHTNLESGRYAKLLTVLQKYFRQLLLAKIGIGKLQEDYPIEKLKNILTLLEKLSYQADTANVNQKLALEVLLLEL